MQERTAIFLVVIPVFIIVMLVRGNVAAATGITVGWALVGALQWATGGWPFNRKHKS